MWPPSGAKNTPGDLQLADISPCLTGEQAIGCSWEGGGTFNTCAVTNPIQNDQAALSQVSWSCLLVPAKCHPSVSLANSANCPRLNHLAFSKDGATAMWNHFKHLFIYLFYFNAHISLWAQSHQSPEQRGSMVAVKLKTIFKRKRKVLKYDGQPHLQLDRWSLSRLLPCLTCLVL